MRNKIHDILGLERPKDRRAIQVRGEAKAAAIKEWIVLCRCASNIPIYSSKPEKPATPAERISSFNSSICSAKDRLEEAGDRGERPRRETY